MKRPLRTTAAALVTAFALAACSGAPEAGDLEPRQPTTVEVENYNSMLVTVDVIAGGQDFRLGQVETGTSETFEMPETTYAMPVQILIDPIGSTANYLSSAVNPMPGDVIDVRVGGVLEQSAVTLH